jgi:hypothetical protein
VSRRGSAAITYTEVTITRIVRGKGVPWHRASCDDHTCIGHEGIGLVYPEQRGKWTGQMYRVLGWSKREALRHIDLYHPGAKLILPPEQ